mgnify:CR=1 FL=1
MRSWSIPITSLARSMAFQSEAGIFKISSGEPDFAIHAQICTCCSEVSKSRCSISSIVFILVYRLRFTLGPRRGRLRAIREYAATMAKIKEERSCKCRTPAGSQHRGPSRSSNCSSHFGAYIRAWPCQNRTGIKGEPALQWNRPAFCQWQRQSPSWWPPPDCHACCPSSSHWSVSRKSR